MFKKSQAGKQKIYPVWSPIRRQSPTPPGSVPDWDRDSGKDSRHSGGMFPKSGKGHPAT